VDREREREGGEGSLVYVYRAQICAKQAGRGVLFVDARREGESGKRGWREGRNLLIYGAGRCISIYVIRR